MAKIYEITAKGNTWQVFANNTKDVKQYVAKKFGIKKVPKGTVIKKVGLSKNIVNNVIPSEPTAMARNRDMSPVGAAEQAAKNRRKAQANRLTRENKEQARLEAIKADTIQCRGFSVLKSKAIKLTKKTTFSNCTIVYKSPQYGFKWMYHSEDCTFSLLKGTTMWMYEDHTTDQRNLEAVEAQRV